MKKTLYVYEQVINKYPAKINDIQIMKEVENF